MSATNPFLFLADQLLKGMIGPSWGPLPEGHYTTPVEYDKHGRMRYHPEIHLRQKEPWSSDDEKYLIENYAKLGPEDVSFSLGRTITTVMTRAYELRKKGLMPKAIGKTMTKRLRAQPDCDSAREMSAA